MKRQLLAIFILSQLFSFGIEKDNDFKKVYYHTGHSTPMLIVLKDDLSISQSEAKAYLIGKLNLKSDENLIVVGEKTDQLGFTHVKYQQVNQGIEVFGAEFQAHLRNGRVEKYTGHYFPNIAVELAGITSSESLQKGLNYFNAQEYMWEDVTEEALLKRVKHNPKATYLPLPKLMYFNTTGNLSYPEFDLVYMMEIYAKTPMRKEILYVDAQNGKILNTINQLHDVSTSARAVSRFSDTLDIITEQVGANSYLLQDLTRGGGVETYNMNTGTSFGAATSFTNNSTFWDLVNSNMDEVAIDAHWGAEMTYDYFLQEHSRNSYDGNGSVLLSYVHYDQNWSNASWDGVKMRYGDGSVAGNPFLAIDIVGHEISHGVTGNSAGLIYQGESGALNESFSDVFGNSIEYYADSARASWYVGEQCFNTLRNMADPREFNDPNTYQGLGWSSTAMGAFDNGGVHTNSGVQNHWYYLLVEGGIGTNDNGDDFNVTPMGWDIAGDIAYRNLSVYLTAGSDYEDAGIFGVQSSDDFFGMCSVASENVNEAWYAVGVLRRLDAEIDVDFLLNKSYACVLPLGISFENLTIGGTTYIWEFGDGGSTSAQNASHSYTAPGIYDVTLTAYLNNGCYLDTGVVIKTLNVIELGSPVLAGCTPDVDFNLNSVGINKVKLHGLELETGLEDGEYIDYTCFTNTIMHIDSMYELIVSTSPSSKENVRVWVDFNQDGTFDSSELIFTEDETYETHIGMITFNTFQNITLYTPLRMRVASDIFFSKTYDACDGVVNGQIEDYSILLTDDWNATLNPVSSLDETLNSYISIYPNPVKDYLFVEITNNEILKSVSIIDVIGKEVINSTLSKVDLSGLPSGSYIVEVNTSASTYTKKIVKE